MAKEIPTKGSELIVYQISELKALMTEMKTETKTAHDAFDRRITAIELWRAGEEEREKTQPKIDIQKIILAAFGLVASAIAVIQSGILRM